MEESDCWTNSYWWLVMMLSCHESACGSTRRGLPPVRLEREMLLPRSSTCKSTTLRRWLQRLCGERSRPARSSHCPCFTNTLARVRSLGQLQEQHPLLLPRPGFHLESAPDSQARQSMTLALSLEWMLLKESIQTATSSSPFASGRLKSSQGSMDPNRGVCRCRPQGTRLSASTSIGAWGTPRRTWHQQQSLARGRLVCPAMMPPCKS
mmetsp:Transcript_17223/g.40066  ORF Transcript_17223/g.40066 Transcript_17223/m.40066 type:complete len:208 (-) Transcript_17223:172-795(-)